MGKVGDSIQQEKVLSSGSLIPKFVRRCLQGESESEGANKFMSYARFIEGDVYIFADVRGGYTCCWCSLAPPSQGLWIWEPESTPLHDLPADFNCQTLTELRVHVLAHIEAGHSVPSRCLNEIEKELVELSESTDP